MSTFDRSLSLAKGVIPAVAMIVVVIARAGSGPGLMIVPFVAVAVIGIVQTVRRSGFFGERRIRASISDSAARGRTRADEILGQGD